MTQLQFSARVGIPSATMGLEVFGPAGILSVDGFAGEWPKVYATIRQEFAALVRGGGRHPLDVQRGLDLQRLVEEAERQMQGG